MPDEPNRSVEEQLKAWAQKRRGEAGAPVELHPATRKLFQDEVERTFSKKTAEAPAPAGGWLKLFWPRLALASSIGAVLIILAGLSGPTLFEAKSKAQRITAFNYLKQIGLAAKTYASDHGGKLPANFGQMTNELGTVKVLKDPETGQEFVYLGAGKIEGDRDSILAYSPTVRGSRPVLLGDGYVQEMDETQFKDALQHTQKGNATVALATPLADAPALAESKVIEREVSAKADSKDARLKSVDDAGKAGANESLGKTTPLELASVDKANEAPPPPAVGVTVLREPGTDRARSEVLMRQRYGLAPAQAGGVASRADVLSEKQTVSPPAQASAAQKPQLTQEIAGGARGVGGVGGGGFGQSPGVTSRVTPDEKNVALANQNTALPRQGRAVVSAVDSLALQRDAGKPGNGNPPAYYADTSSAQAGQRYTQARRYRVNFNSPPMPNVLRSFQVEQTGQQIRVVDADGSVYEGVIGQPVNEEVSKRSLAAQTAGTGLKKNLEPELRRAENAPASTASETAEQQNIFFRVAGTNRSLNQLVVFQGNFVANTNQTNVALLGAKLEAEQTPVAQPQNRPLPGQQPLNALIQGQATIDGRDRIQINASPVGP